MEGRVGKGGRSGGLAAGSRRRGRGSKGKHPSLREGRGIETRAREAVPKRKNDGCKNQTELPTGARCKRPYHTLRVSGIPLPLPIPPPPSAACQVAIGTAKLHRNHFLRSLAVSTDTRHAGGGEAGERWSDTPSTQAHGHQYRAPVGSAVCLLQTPFFA